MCTCGWSPSYMRRRDAEKGWIEEFCRQILENPECHMKDNRKIQLRCAVWENRFGPCHQSAFTGALMAPKTFLRLLQPFCLWCGKLFFLFWLRRTRCWSVFQASVDRKNIYMQKNEKFLVSLFSSFSFSETGRPMKNNTLLISLASIKVTEIKALFAGSPSSVLTPFHNQRNNCSPVFSSLFFMVSNLMIWQQASRIQNARSEIIINSSQLSWPSIALPYLNPAACLMSHFS